MPWNVELPPAETYSLQQADKLQELENELLDQTHIAIDTETDGLILWKCLPHYWSLSWRAQGRKRRVMMPAHTLQLFSKVFADPDRYWIGANLKFDLHMLANYGIDIKGQLIDIAVMHALLYEEQPHDLKSMAKSILGWRWTDFQDTFGSIRKGNCICGATNKSHEGGLGICKKTGCNVFRQITPLDVMERMKALDYGKLVDYASNDAYGTYEIYVALRAELEAASTWSLYPDSWPYINTMADYYFNIELPFTRVLYTCERNGIKVDRNYLEEMSPRLEKEASDLRKAIVEEAGYLLNPSSNPQLIDYFFVRNGLKPLKWTKGGASGVKKPSVDGKFLESVADDFKIADLILQLRYVEKQRSTYVDDLPTHMDPHDRVHCRLNQDVARTGRISSSEPNLTNQPTGEKDKYGIRNAFICNDGNVLVVSDYEQLEMRLLAAASMEASMCSIFSTGKDIHTGNAELVYGVPYDEIVEAKNIDKAVKSGKLPPEAMTDRVHYCLKIRKDIKIVGFGLNYGMKAGKLSRQLGCSKDEAQEKLDAYMATYPTVERFYADTINEAREVGFAFTILGRRRRMSSIWSSNTMDRWQAERQASNLPIQGSAADVCKVAMIHIYNEGLHKRYECRMLLQVHDELVFECPKEAAREVMPIIKECMEHPFQGDLAVPLTTDIGYGKSWGKAK